MKGIIIFSAMVLFFTNAGFALENVSADKFNSEQEFSQLADKQEIETQNSQNLQKTNKADENLNRHVFRRGERALNIERDSVLVEVLSRDLNGLYVIKYHEGPLRGQVGGNWNANDLAKMRGCTSQYLCVGERLLNNERDWVDVRVVGIQANELVVLKYLEGPLRGQKGGNWNYRDLAYPRGCGDYYCVGTLAYNIERDYVRVRIIAIQNNGLYVLRFLEGPLSGQKGGNWKDASLAEAKL